MQNAGTIEIEVFELNYRQDLSNAGFYFGWNMQSIAIEPLLQGSSYLNSGQVLQALGLEDYGYMYCGDRVLGYNSLQYNGKQFSQFTSHDGAATNDSADATPSTYTISMFDLLPSGRVAGGPPQAFQPATVYNHFANIQGDNGHLDAALTPGPCAFPQDFSQIDGTIHTSDFVLPYCQYDYFQLYAIGAELGIPFCDQYGVPLTSPGGMIGAKNSYNTGFESGQGATNMLGTFVQANTYLPAHFFPWSLWNPRGQEVTATVQITDAPAEQPLQNIFNNGSYWQNARNFFLLMGGQLFDGQPQTPVVYDPAKGLYSPVKMTGMTPAAQQMIAQPGGLQIAYSTLQNAFFMIGSPPNYPEYIFAANYVYPVEQPVIEKPPHLSLSLPRFGVVPKIRMPCYGVRQPQPKMSR